MDNIHQNTPEWEEMRKTKIGASDAPVIMEVSPWKTPYQLWQEKLSLVTHQNNYAMNRGHSMEPAARASFEDMTGIMVTPMVKFHPIYNWMMASLDAVDISGENIAEIKCPGQSDHQQAIAGILPEKYFPQLQHQIEVCQVDFSYYFSFDGTNGVLLKVYRDDKYIKNMISKELKFWECVQELTSPELTLKDYHEKNEPEWINAALEWQRIQRQIHDLTQKEEEIRKQLVSLANNHSSCGGGVRVSKLLRKGNVDYKKIPELKVIDLDSYRKPATEYWKIISA